MHGKGKNLQWFLCIPTACLISEDNTITPIADPYFLSEAAQCQKYTLSDLVDHVDPKHTAAKQVVTVGAFCYPMVVHLREKDKPYNPYKRSLYALTYRGDSFFFLQAVPRECGPDNYSICKSNDGVCANTVVLSLSLHPPVHILE